MNLDITNKLNKLLQGSQDGKLYLSAWLKQNAYSDQLIRQYRISGWLSMLHSGVMYRTGAKLSSWGALSSYNNQIGKTFHVAAHSALELAGFNHYVPMGKTTLVVHHKKDERIPTWMQVVELDSEFRFFTTEIFTKQEVHLHTKGDFNMLISSAEQAFLECLHLAPKHYMFMDLYYIMEQLTTLRANVVQSLLEGCTSNKVKRLFLYMAEKANHYWYEDLDLSKIDIGKGKYQLAEGGVYLSKYKITIPEELYSYE